MQLGYVSILAVALVAAGVAVGLCALVVLHVVPSGLSARRNPVSQYGITRYAIGYRVQTVSYGVAGVGAALCVAESAHRGPVVIVLCLVFALARGAIGWFPMDEPGGERSATGRRHGQLAIAAFVGLGIAALAWSKELGVLRAGSGYVRASELLGIVMLGSLVAMAVDRRSSARNVGLFERVFYVAMTAWLVLVACMVAIGGTG